MLVLRMAKSVLLESLNLVDDKSNMNPQRALQVPHLLAAPRLEAFSRAAMGKEHFCPDFSQQGWMC